MSSPAQAINGRVAVFIASSDNTYDVFERVFPAFRKFWPDCPFPVYAGFNTKTPADPAPVLAPASGWRDELRQQIESLKEDYVLLLLDDFLFLEAVDDDRARNLIAMAVERDLPYARMVPASRALLPLLFTRLVALFARDPFQVLPGHMPYYSSLQVALWRREHLLGMFGEEGNIWQFEHQRDPNAIHYVLRDRPALRYLHVVEKGKWQANAGELFARAGLSFDPGSREVRPSGARFQEYLKTWKFLLIGYSIVRLKRWWRGR